MENIENKYFIDDETYNCPFCKIRGVKYITLGIIRFNETNSKELHSIFIECSQCHKISMHLSRAQYLNDGLKILLIDSQNKEYKTYAEGSFVTTKNKLSLLEYTSWNDYGGWISSEFQSEEGVSIDDAIILHIPSSFFTIDKMIPKHFRELINEAEKCISNNCLTGASACIRKTIYEFINKEKLEGKDYTTKIKSLKGKYSTLDDRYVDILSAIQGITSDQVHEQSYEDFDIQHVKGYIEVLKEVFNQIYVIPNELTSTHSRISSMFSAVKEDKKSK